MTEVQLAKEIGFNIKRALDEYDMTQVELSELTGISKSTITKYIYGDAIPSIRNLINIAYVLECSLTDLIDVDEFII